MCIIMVFSRLLEYFKILKKGHFVQVTSLKRIISGTVEIISEKVNMGYCLSKKMIKDGLR